MSISKITGASIEDGSITLADLGITTIDSGTGNTLTLQANSATGIVIDTSGNTAIANTLSFTGTGARIRGDFSNGTVVNRTAFQTSTTNDNTFIPVIGNGTGVSNGIEICNSSDAGNAGILQMSSRTTDTRIAANARGVGSFLPLTMYTGGSERLRIDTSGNVGIGTSSPSSLLNVSASDSTGINVRFDITNTQSGSLLSFLSSGTTFSAAGWPAISDAGIIRSGVSSSGGLVLTTAGSTAPIIFSPESTERMRLDATGRLGIGTTSPSQRLHVAAGTILSSNTAGTIATVSIAGNGSTVGTSDFALQQGTSSEAYVYNRANSFLVLGTNNTERMRINAAGDVGIRTASFSTLASSGRGLLEINGTSDSAMGFKAGDTLYGYLYTSSTEFRIANITANPLIFYTNNTERMRIDSSGRVGIAATSMSYHLEVGNGTADTRFVANPNNAYAIGVKNGANNIGGWIGSPSGGVLSFSANDGTERMRIDASGNLLIGRTSQSTGDWFVTAQGGYTATSQDNSVRSQLFAWTGLAGTGTFTNHDFTFRTNNTEKMRITSGGNVGIGTSSPDNNAGYIALSITGSTGGQIYWRSTGSSVSAYAGADSTGGYIATLSDHALIFRTNNTERGRFTNQGAFMVGTNIAVNSTDLVHKIGDVASGTAYARLMMQERGGNWISFNDGAGTHYGTIVRSGSGVSYGSNSDYRLKENIVPMTGALNKVAQLKPCTYTWKSTGEAGQGFIAHELQEVIPDAVSGEKDGINPETDTPAYQTVDTSFLVATLTAAIQEQQAIIESLKSRIEILEQK
jgi:hypothetical protein